MTGLKSRMLKGGAAIAAMRIYSIVLAILLMILLAKWMEPKELGSFLVGVNLVFFVSVFGMVGLNQSMIRIVAGQGHSASKRELNRVIVDAWMLAGMGSLLAGVIAAFALYSWLGDWLNCDARSIFPIVVGSALLSAHKLLAALLRSIHSIGASGLFDGRLGGPLANTIYILIAMVYSTQPISSSTALWLFAASLAVTLPIGWVTWRHAWRNSLRDFLPTNTAKAEGPPSATHRMNLLVRDSTPYLIVQLAIFFCGEFDVWLAGAYLAPEETALFGSARRLIVQIQQPLSILSVTLASSFAELYSKGKIDELERLVRFSTSLIVLATLPVFALCILMPEFIMVSFFGEYYRSGASLLLILTIGQIGNCVTGQCGQVLLMAGKVRVTIIINLLCGLLLLIGGISATKQFGIVGLTIVSALITTLQYVLMWLFAKQTVGIWTHPGLKLPRHTRTTGGVHF